MNERMRTRGVVKRVRVVMKAGTIERVRGVLTAGGTRLDV